MLVVSRGIHGGTGLPVSAGSPAIINSTGTTVQLYDGQNVNATPAAALVNVPGSNRLDGAQWELRASGEVFPGVASNIQLMVYANYPAGQWANANITSASMASNVALYNANNNYVVGMFVTVANIVNTSLNGTVGPLTAANNTSFSAANVNGATLAIANIANAAQVATGVITSVPLYTSAVSPTLAVNTNIPFMVDIRCAGGQRSNIVTCTGTDQTVNNNGTALVPNSSTGTVLPVPGVNFALEPCLYLTIGHTWGASNANNQGFLKSMYLES